MFPNSISLKSGSFYIKDEHLTDNLPLVEIPDEPFPDYIRSYNLKNLVDAEFEMEAEIDIPMLHRLSTTITDVYDFAAKKQSLKKWEIDLNIHHQELGLAWDKPVDRDLWDKVDASILSGAQSLTAVYSEPYQVQRRKHKKKRINKKWAKRYGFVTKYRKWRISEITMTSPNDFEFEATGRNVELVSR